MSERRTLSAGAWLSLIGLAIVSLFLGFLRGKPGEVGGAELLGQVAGAVAAPWIAGLVVAGLWLLFGRMTGRATRFRRVFLWAGWIFAFAFLFQTFAAVTLNGG
jgi:hypothetical protein